MRFRLYEFFKKVQTFPNQFSDLDPNTDKNLLQKLITPEELSGILNWALIGLKRLLKQERFTGAKSVDILREQYDRGSDPIKSFLEECTENVGGESTPKSTLFEAFCEYCKEHSIPMIYTMKGTFGDRIKKIYIGGSQKIDGKPTRVWQGCKLTGYVKHVPNVSTLTITGSNSANRVVKKRLERVKRNQTMQEKL